MSIHNPNIFRDRATGYRGRSEGAAFIIAGRLNPDDPMSLTMYVERVLVGSSVRDRAAALLDLLDYIGATDRNIKTKEEES